MTADTVAAQRLLDQLAGRVPERRRIVVLRADLVTRASRGKRVTVP